MQAAQQRDGSRDVAHVDLTSVDEGHPARDVWCPRVWPRLVKADENRRSEGRFGKSGREA